MDELMEAHSTGKPQPHTSTHLIGTGSSAGGF
jgi:hypothetical protein